MLGFCPVFTVKDLRKMISSMPQESFIKQMGPFALVQRPPAAILLKAGIKEHEDGVQRTAMAKASDISTNILSLLFEFDTLNITTLPPLTDEDLLVVGRLPDCDVVVEHASVSKRHASLRWHDKDKRCTVKDDGSTNGTFVNDTGIGEREATLRDGDIVTFGEIPFWFLLTSTLYSKLSNRSTSNKLGSRSG